MTNDDSIKTKKTVPYAKIAIKTLPGLFGAP
jgi:hypothetical protein